MAYMMKYKVGDKVIILAKSKSTTGSPPYSEDIAECIGKSGFIEEIYSSGETFVFKSLEPKEGYMGIFLPRELRLYTEAESIDEQVRKVLVEGTTINYGTTSTPHKFKVGDRVRVTKSVHPSDIKHNRVGKVITITEILGDVYYPYIDSEDTAYSEDQLELVTDKPKKDFKAGDRVRIKTDNVFPLTETFKKGDIAIYDGFIGFTFEKNGISQCVGDKSRRERIFEKVEEPRQGLRPLRWPYYDHLLSPSMPFFMPGDTIRFGNNAYGVTKPSPKGGGIMSNLTSMAKRYLSPSVKKLLKAKFITEGFNRTSKGEEALMDILWQKHEKELLDAATKQIKADKKAKKNEDSDEEE